MSASTRLGLAILATTLAGCGVADLPQATDPSVSGGELEVACSATGLTVSADTVEATPSGVPVSVSSTAASGTYLNIGWDGGGQGDPAPRSSEEWTVPAPPGELTIWCSNPGKEWPAERVHVIDPRGHWRPTTLSDAGCPPGAMPSWVVGPGRGATAEEAVKDLLAAMTGADWASATVALAPVGYPQAPTQTWIVSLSGRPEISVLVKSVGPVFEASPDAFCHA